MTKSRKQLAEELFGEGVRHMDLTVEQRRIYQREWRRRYAKDYPDRYRELGRRGHAASKAKREADPERMAAHRAYQADYRRRRKDKFPEYYRRYRLKVEYGLTLAGYEHMLNEQDNRCGICGAKRVGRGKEPRLHVDHDHKTGRVRSLLCHHCNMMIGHAKDRPWLLRRAAEYVEAHCAGRTWVRPLLERVFTPGEETGGEGRVPMGDAEPQRGREVA